MTRLLLTHPFPPLSLSLSLLPFWTLRLSTPLYSDSPPPSSCLFFSSPVLTNLRGQQDGGQGVDSVSSCHSDTGMDWGSESDQLHKVSCLRAISDISNFRYARLSMSLLCICFLFYILHVHMWHALLKPTSVQIHDCVFFPPLLVAVLWLRKSAAEIEGCNVKMWLASRKHRKWQHAVIDGVIQLGKCTGACPTYLMFLSRRFSVSKCWEFSFLNLTCALLQLLQRTEGVNWTWETNKCLWAVQLQRVRREGRHHHWDLLAKCGLIVLE